MSSTAARRRSTGATLFLVGSTLAAAACASTPAAEGGAASAGVSAVPPAGAMVATLTPVNSPITGTVRLEPSERANQSRATISIRGANIGAELPWQIRQGTCQEDGPEVGPLAAYRPLLVRADGTADARVPLPIALEQGRTYHVRVLFGRTQMDRQVACGVLSVEG